MKIGHIIGRGIALAALGLLTGCASMRYPSLGERQEVRALSSEAVKPNCKLSIKARHEESVGRLIDMLENVPDQMQTYCNEFGATVEIVDKKIRNTDTVKNNRIEAWNHWAGVYIPELKTALVPYNNPEVALHEYGHVLDSSMTNTAEEDSFQNLFRTFKARRSLVDRFIGINEHYASAPTELFAESFKNFYFSDKSRAKLKRRFPEMHKYFQDLEGYFTKADKRE